MLKVIKLALLGVLSLGIFSEAWANLPYYPIQFPRDDAAHYENVPYQAELKNLMEWWYYNGTLVSKTGKKLGYYLSFNYVYEAKNNILIPFVQIQVTDVENKKVYGKQIFLTDRKSFSMSTSELDIQNGKTFSLKKNNDAYIANGSLPSAEDGTVLEFSLKFTPKPGYDVLLVEGNGLADMWNDKNSYYYSFTKLVTEGYMRIGKEVYELDPAQSLSWMDHQWGDFFITPGKNEWMWTSIQLKNGLDVNAHVILDKKTKKPIAGTASVVMPDNSRFFVKDLSKLSYVAEPIQPGEKHPLTYHFSIPELDLNLTMDALVSGQDVNGIWEGISKVEGNYKGQSITGQAYTENSAVY